MLGSAIQRLSRANRGKSSPSAVLELPKNPTTAMHIVIDASFVSILSILLVQANGSVCYMVLETSSTEGKDVMWKLSEGARLPVGQGHCRL
jgi:hypothetical protein